MLSRKTLSDCTVCIFFIVVKPIKIVTDLLVTIHKWGWLIFNEENQVTWHESVIINKRVDFYSYQMLVDVE